MVLWMWLRDGLCKVLLMVAMASAQISCLQIELQLVFTFKLDINFDLKLISNNSLTSVTLTNLNYKTTADFVVLNNE